jgi:multiple sugar transport system substrate-binding protein
MVATIKDVAKKAGVSIATVSNYLNNTNPVRKETATRIQAAIDSLGYKQNYMARNLKAQRYTDVGVILPDLDNPYYVQIFQGIEKTFHQSKYYLTLAFSYDDPEREAEIIDNLLKKQVAGLVLVPSMVDNWKFYYHHLVSRDKPLVILDRQIDNLETNFIAFENEKAIADLAKSLIDQGKRNLVLITGPRKYREEQLCIDAFLEVCSQNDIDINQALQVYSVGTSKEETFRITTNLLRRFLPDAILTTNGAGAVGIIESLSFLGYSTNDIPVATLGEERWNKYTHSISSLSSQRPAIQMGEQAAQLLLEQLKSPFVSENRRILMTDKILTKEPHPVRYVQYQPIQIDRNGQTLKVLLLDTYQTHALSGLFSNFTSATGIAVDATSIPHPELFERIIQESRKAPGDSPFDVVMFDIPWLYTLASSKVLADISPHIERKEINPGIFLPRSFEYFSRFEKGHYGLPFMYAPQILFYRKDLFEDPFNKTEFDRLFKSKLRPPQTWKEFNAICEFFTSHTDHISYGTSIPASHPEYLAPEIYMRLFSSNSQVFDKNNQVTFSNPRTLKAYIDLIKVMKHVKPNYLQTSDMDAVKDFLLGETAMLITYPSFLYDEELISANPGILNNIAHSNIPGNAPILGGWSLGIFAQSEQKDQAFDFIKWACSDKISDYFALMGGYSAVESTYLNDELTKLYPWFPLYHSTYKTTRPILPPRTASGKIVSQNKIDSIICHGVYELLKDSSDIPSVIEKTHKALEELILSHEETT